MALFDDILKSAQFSQSINNSLGLTSQIKEMLKQQEIITNSFSGLNMMTEIAKSMKLQHTFSNPAITGIDAIINSMRNQSNFVIPDSTIDAITLINRQHEQLFGGIKTVIDSLNFQSPAISQINNLQIALNGISGQIAAIAAYQKDWTLIDDFKEVSEQALEFTDTLSEELDEEQERQFQILLTLVLSFLNKHKTLGVSALLVIDIFLRFAGIHQYYDFIKEKPELATKNHVNQISIKQDSVIHYIQIVNEQLKQVNEYRITNRNCEVKSKPKLKTITLTKLPINFEVVIIQVHHKWVYVSYFDPKDNLPQTGWILKKYLNKP